MTEYIKLTPKGRERIVEALCNEVHLDFITEDIVRSFVETLSLKPPYCEEQLFLMTDSDIVNRTNLGLRFHHYWSSAHFRALGQAMRDLQEARSREGYWAEYSRERWGQGPSNSLAK